MTGQGAGAASVEGRAVTVELRSVNNRFLKVVSHAPAALETHLARVEERVKQRLRRGTVTIHLRLAAAGGTSAVAIAEDVVSVYLAAIDRIRASRPDLPAPDWASLLTLPGVLDSSARTGGGRPTDPADDDEASAAWASAVDQAAEAALSEIEAARAREGDAMALSLRQWLAELTAFVDEIEHRASTVPEAAQRRLVERVGRLLASTDVAVDRADLAREVALIADRADITEEIVRLRTHVTAFEDDLAETEAPGRRLDFLVQEMGRETNTIGSKSSDATISARVIDIKSQLERIRELIQNVE